MAASTIKNLREALGLGLGTMTRIWEEVAKDWVTGIDAADVDRDGEPEVVACSRDGRVYLISSEGNKLWNRILGGKSWVGTVVATDASPTARDTFAHIVAGTRNGRAYILDEHGNIVTKDGDCIPFDGKDILEEDEHQLYWYNTKCVIRQVTIVDSQQPQIIVASDDAKACSLDYHTGEILWTFEAKGGVHTVRSYLNADGQARILAGSVDGYLYLLNHDGNLLDKHYVGHPLHTIAVTGSATSDRIDIFVASDNKDLTAFTYYENHYENYTEEQYRDGFVKKWCRSFKHRIISLTTTDLDGDGKLEIIAGSEDKYIYILDDEGNIVWRHNHKYRAFSICPCDIDKDGLPELLIGNENSRIRAMRVRLHKGLEQRIRRHYHALKKTQPALLDDLTADERSQLMAVVQPNTSSHITFQQARLSSESNEHDTVLSKLLQLQQQEVEQCWQKNDIKHIRSMCLRHTANDSKHEIVVGTSDDNVYALTAKGRLSWSIAFKEHITNLQARATSDRKREENIICTSNQHEYVIAKARKVRKQQEYAHSALHTTDEDMMTQENQPAMAVSVIDSFSRNERQDTIEKVIQFGTQKAFSARSFSEERIPEIIAIVDEKRVSVFTKNKKLLYTYVARDPIRAVCTKDINGDGKIEVLIGSEDRNIHVVDASGHLLWRYYLPDSVLAIDVAPMDDGQIAIFAGCADSNLYVFNKDGLLLWNYQAKDRIYAVRVEDIDADGTIEIVLGSEDGLELLRIVNQQNINRLIAQNWQAFTRQHGYKKAIEKLLMSDDAFLQVFALHKLVEDNEATQQDFAILEKFMKNKEPEIRKALVHAIMKLYPLDSARVKNALATLWSDSDRDMRNAFIEQIPLLMNHDWQAGFDYLKRTFEFSDRYVKRIIIRTLHQLIDVSTEMPLEWQQNIFELLLAAAQSEDSEWVRQEAARTMAHFLNQYHGNLVVYVHLFIVKSLRVSVLKDIAYATTVPVVKNFLHAVILILDDLNVENALERLHQVVKALEGISTFAYGKALLLVYNEMLRLFSINTIEEIAAYQCELRANQFDADNKFALHMLDIFNRLSSVNRPLKMYLRREDVQDRMTSLLETLDALDKAFTYLEQKYAIQLMNEPITRLPDRQIFFLLLTKWRKQAFTLLGDLRGKPELQVELQTKLLPRDEQVSIWLRVENKGRSSAHDVRVTLLHNELFEIVENNFFNFDLFLPREETTLEFTIQPSDSVLDLQFEVAYDDADNQTTIEKFVERLHLREAHQAFRLIPNPYSSGLPMLESSMFYGRDNDIATLQDYLTRDTKNVVVLYGQRRSGKTTLLMQLCNLPDTSSAICILIDLQNMSYEMESIEKLLHRFAYIITKTLKTHDLSLCLPELTTFAENPTYAFDVFLDQLEEQLAGRRLNLLIDEFELLEEHVIGGELRPQIFEYLRDIVQHRRNINFLFSGTHKITEFTKWYRSVFFQIAQHHRLSRLDFQGAEDLIVKPVQGFLEYEPYSLAKVHGLTADQPYLIHLICNAVVEYCNDRQKTFVTINDINAVLDQVMLTGGYHFDWLWDQIKPDVRLALMILAEGGREDGRWLSTAEIESLYRFHHLPYRRDYVLDAFKTLQEADIIEPLETTTGKRTSGSRRYRIAVGLIRNWLLEEHSLASLASELLD